MNCCSKTIKYDLYVLATKFDMKKIKVFICFFLILFLLNLISVKAITTRLENNKRIILIDPGHGGFDGGAVSKSGTIEKEINLSIGLMLKDELAQRQYGVCMTREDDRALNESGKSIKEKKLQDLIKRGNLKKETNCSMFISIHQNMYPKSNSFGAQVWHSNNDKSKLFSEVLQNHLKEELDNKNKRLPKAALDNYRVLRDNYEAPCVILECGFLSNPEEYKKLSSKEYQKSMATTIANAIDDYFAKIDSWN